MTGADTIFALSSGSPPAAIAVLRISGPQAAVALAALTGGRLPRPRHASVVRLSNPIDGSLLDTALVLHMLGPRSATGEDCVELHLHGGRAVVEGVEAALGRMEGLRPAEAGEFTRRAFANGRLDLAEAEGLADLLSAETQLQLRNAQALVSGVLSRQAEEWRETILRLSASLEAVLDFSDEDDVSELPADFSRQCARLSAEIRAWLQVPTAEKLREGFRVVIAGPPNSGKSTLFNIIVGEEAAIATPIAGTTRDALHRPVALDGLPFLFVDTAGLRQERDVADVVETIGIGRAMREIEQADLVLWLGPEGEGPEGAWEIEARIDADDAISKAAPNFRLSAVTGVGVGALLTAMVEAARKAMPAPGQVAVSRFQRNNLASAAASVQAASVQSDILLAAEELRGARLAFDRLLGRAATEDMLDALFGRFCIGK